MRQKNLSITELRQAAIAEYKNSSRYAVDQALASLTKEYEEFNRANNLALGSADEHLFDKTLTQKQRDWLKDFSRRWDEASDAQVRS